jgi:hypothetical protein
MLFQLMSCEVKTKIRQVEDEWKSFYTTTLSLRMDNERKHEVADGDHLPHVLRNVFCKVFKDFPFMKTAEVRNVWS